MVEKGTGRGLGIPDEELAGFEPNFGMGARDDF